MALSYVEEVLMALIVVPILRPGHRKMDIIWASHLSSSVSFSIIEPQHQAQGHFVSARASAIIPDENERGS